MWGKSSPCNIPISSVDIRIFDRRLLGRAILCELAKGERRVAGTPETVKKFKALGADVAVEAGAGLTAAIADADYAAMGATLADRAATVAGADIILGVQGPDPASIAGARPGAWIVAGLNAYAAAGFEALAMEFMPRITRAQSMDILSSQSNLAGYKAVLDAAYEYGRAFPMMMMTAAGRVSPAKAFIMGVGVAGLQAIATAKRLGAKVSATDVRLATREQIESLGAKAVFVESVAGIEGEGTDGYATEMSEDYQKAQAELVSSHIAKQDIVITTALIPGKPAPRLISDASALFARNLYNFLSAFWKKDQNAPLLDEEIGNAIRITQGGKVVNERLLAKEHALERA